jgi:hypothetical protein
MKVGELTERQVSPGVTRIRVVRVFVDPPERLALGVPDDTERLTGQTGTVRRVHLGPLPALDVDWDTRTPGTLSLAAEDEIEFIDGKEQA